MCVCVIRITSQQNNTIEKEKMFLRMRLMLGLGGSYHWLRRGFFGGAMACTARTLRTRQTPTPVDPSDCMHTERWRTEPSTSLTEKVERQSHPVAPPTGVPVPPHTCGLTNSMRFGQREPQYERCSCAVLQWTNPFHLRTTRGVSPRCALVTD